MRWRLIAALILLALVVVAVLLFRPHPKPPPPPPLTVETLTVAPKTVPEVIETSGTVVSLDTAEVRPQTTGVLTSVRVRDGQEVKKGELLFTIDPRPLVAERDQARANLGRDQALAADAADTVSRYKVLASEDSVAAKTYTTAVETLKSLRATVAADRALVDQAEASLAYTQIRAPIDGRAGAVLVKVGNLAAVGSSTPLVILNTSAPIEVSFGLPHVQVDAVRRAMGEHGSRGLAVTAIDAVSGKAVAQGALVFQDNAFDQSSGTLAFRARFANRDHALTPSQYITARVTLSDGIGVLAVPETALQQGQKGSYVYVLADGHAHVRQLIIARLVEGQAVVTQGLHVGDQIILTVPNDLRDGSAVRSANAPAAQNPAGAKPAPPKPAAS